MVAPETETSHASISRHGAMLALQGNAGTASQRGIYAPCLGREHIDKAGCSRLLSMRRHQRVVSSSTELSKLVESAEEHHWEPVKRAAFLLFSICFGQVHPSRPFPYVVFFAPGGTHGAKCVDLTQHRTGLQLTTYLQIANLHRWQLA